MLPLLVVVVVVVVVLGDYKDTTPEGSSHGAAVFGDDQAPSMHQHFESVGIMPENGPTRLLVLLVTVLLASWTSSSSAFTLPLKSPYCIGPLQNTKQFAEKNLAEDDEIVDIDEGKTQISKAKWKKKRFLMIKDINASIQQKQAHAAHKAEEAVRRHWKLWEMSGDDFFKPDLTVYNLWIHAIAKNTNQASKDSGYIAEAVVKEMKERQVPPNVVSYTSVMDVSHPFQPPHPPPVPLRTSPE